MTPDSEKVYYDPAWEIPDEEDQPMLGGENFFEDAFKFLKKELEDENL